MTSAVLEDVTDYRAQPHASVLLSSPQSPCEVGGCSDLCFFRGGTSAQPLPKVVNVTHVTRPAATAAPLVLVPWGHHSHSDGRREGLSGAKVALLTCPRDLFQVGLFRKSGVKSRIHALRQMNESFPEHVSYEDQSAYDVADMVKQFFRDLPEPLLTNKLSETFLHIYQCKWPQGQVSSCAPRPGKNNACRWGFRVPGVQDAVKKCDMCRFFFYAPPRKETLFTARHAKPQATCFCI